MTDRDAKQRSRRRIALFVGALCLGALALAVAAFYRPVLGSWHISRLRSPEPATRRHAARRLGEIGGARAARVLLELYLSEVHPMQFEMHYAGEALVDLGETALPALAPVLRHPDWTPRNAVAELLAGIGPPAVPALVAALDDPNPSVQRSSLYAIHLMGRRAVSAAAPLERYLERAGPQERELARQALDTVREEPAVKSSPAPSDLGLPARALVPGTR